jgi:hypothetical protein
VRQVSIRIKPGVIPWIRIRLAIVCLQLGWYEAADYIKEGMIEVVR